MPDVPATSLEIATRVDGADGHYRARVDPRWFIWGPNGGYLSALVVRAAAKESAFPQLASYSCQFLGVAQEGEVELRLEPLKRARRADAFRAEMSQGGRPVLTAILRLAAGGLEGLAHRDRPMPDVPGPGSVQPIDSSTPLFQRLERRRVQPEAATPEPVDRTWFRFAEGGRFEDTRVDSLRALIVADTMYWPATAALHGQACEPWTAPGLDLHLRFHDSAPASEWLYCETHAFVAEAGLLAADSAVWTEDGRLVVTSATQALLTPARRS